MTSAQAYAAMVEAYEAQQARIRGREQDRWGGDTAGRFRMDPRRPLSPNLEMIASYLAPDDVLVDVGGGAGRFGLPLALRCKQVINAEPSAGMQANFRELAEEAGIKNVRSVEEDWLHAEGVEGDVCLTVHVTYFIKEIVPFVKKLEAAARKRVIICVNSLALPNSGAPIFELIYNEPHSPVPGHRELLLVLWDMGILPEVRLLPEREGISQMATTKEDVIQRRLVDIPERYRDSAEKLLNARFDEFFVRDGDRYIPAPLLQSRGLLITWEPRP